MQSSNDYFKINNLEKSTNEICQFIQDEIYNKLQKKGAVFGLSGGIDSAVTAALCTKSFEPEQILGLIMPEKESNRSSQILAEQVSKKFNFNTEIIDITKILESFGVYEMKETIVYEKFPEFNSKCKYRVVVPPKSKNIIGIPFLEILDEYNEKHKLKISSSDFLSLTALTSIKHRVRMTLLYFHGEKNNFSVVGTTNKSEYQQGYFVKYGDGGVDIEPLVSLFKTQVYQLAESLNIPSEIIERKASPDTWSFQVSDEEFFFSLTYDIIDLMLYAHEKSIPLNDICSTLEFDEAKVKRILKSQERKWNSSKSSRTFPPSFDMKDIS